MKQQFTIAAVLLCSASSFSQYCNFTSGNWPYTLHSNGGSFVISSANPDFPIGTSYGFENSDALVAAGGEVVLNMGVVNTSNAPFSHLSFIVGAYGMNGSGKGMDLGTDFIKVQIRTSSVASWKEVFRIRGYGNSMWAMDGALSANSLLTPVYTPDDGGVLESDRAISRFTVDDLPMADSLFIRFVLYSDRAVEEWGLDEIELHPTTYWTNASGDGQVLTPSNWSGGVVPDSTSTLYWSDTLSLLPAVVPSVSRLITAVSGRVTFPNTSVVAGEWLHTGGVMVSNTGVELSGKLGSGELIVVRDSVVGSLSVSRVFPFTEGYRHVSVPLHSTWNDVTDDASQVNYNLGRSSSVFGWDATNENWYAFANGTQATKALPAALFGGPSWLDSSTVIRVSGEISQTDTFTVFYGSPNGNSPFATPIGNEGWNLIGNPFPYSLSARALLSDADYPIELSPTLYIWNGRTKTYSSFNLTTGASSNGSSMIQPWQAFWVQFSSDPGIFRTVKVKPEHRGFSHRTGLAKSQVHITDIVVKGSLGERRVSLADVPLADLQWESEYDQYQRNYRDFEVYFTGSAASGGEVRITVKSLDPTNAGGVPLIVECAKGEVIEIRMENAQEDWWLEDVQSDEWYQVNTKSHTYVSEQNTPRKFRMWRTPPLSVAEVAHDDFSVPIFRHGKWQEMDSRHWELLDMQGRIVMSLQPNEVRISTCAPGIYIWRSEGCAQKVVVQPY
ncbi:MAG: hypothetical protein EP346_12430 [Bacteroidetes bacterium]|nr:MAG: hypothetical protein EP346_12430 [Bacteroidota bacterium]